jgi:large subunit ribosomal protein L29
MSTIDVKELRQLSSDELAEELFNLRFQMGTGRLENPMQIRKTKRSIAQVKTVLREVQTGDHKKAS